ncbi:MAG: DUF6049 family protein, partial [Nocardioides sp.]
VLTVTTTASATSAGSTQAATEEALEVVIETLSPSYLPPRGTVRLSGTVTNASDERWRAINVHAFIDDTPLTSSAELATTSTTPVDAEVGTRITLPDTFEDIGSLAPGEQASYSIELQRDQIPVSAAGVYWFGVHALGNTTDARDGVADGRARTLLPLVPPETAGRERAAIVIPIRRTIRHTADGRLRSTARWAADLSVGGRLRALADFGATSGAIPVTWLVDPAVPDAVARLVAGNPPRTFGDVLPPPSPEGESEAPAPDEGSPSAEILEPGDEETGASRDPSNVAAAPGAAWLTELEGALAGNQVLALPYGDPDVAATAAHAPPFYDDAVGRGGTELGRWQVDTTPAVAPPDGFLPVDAFFVLTGDETVLLSDRALASGEVRTSGRVDGQRVLFSSSATALGGPGPGDPLSELALRQRFLAEAAVRLLFHDRTPLLMVLPADFVPSSPTTFWSGLDAPWLELTDTDDLGRGRRVPGRKITYPVEEELTELDAENFTAAEELIAAGRTLDNVLPGNDVVADQVLAEALTSLSYSERDRSVESRRDTAAGTAWINNRLARVRIRAPRNVTLSSAAGTLATTVTNRLDQPVTVWLRTTSLGDVEVETSDPIDLAAGSRQTVLLRASATSAGVHYVRVLVTDEQGTPLGDGQRVAIRSAQVSEVIWLIVGVGVGLLFLAIAIRLVRRIRSERT